MRRRVRVKNNEIDFEYAKSIELIFYDYDTVEIPIKFISNVIISGLSDYITFYKGKKTEYDKSCDYISIGFEKSIESLEYFKFGNPNRKENIINRIRSHKDIVSIVVKYENRKSIEIVVPYFHNDIEENKLQVLFNLAEYGYTLSIDKNNIEHKDT